jgi:hypothetical protein
MMAALNARNTAGFALGCFPFLVAALVAVTPAQNRFDFSRRAPASAAMTSPANPGAPASSTSHRNTFAVEPPRVAVASTIAAATADARGTATSVAASAARPNAFEVQPTTQTATAGAPATATSSAAPGLGGRPPTGHDLLGSGPVRHQLGRPEHPHLAPRSRCRARRPGRGSRRSGCAGDEKRAGCRSYGDPRSRESRSEFGPGRTADERRPGQPAGSPPELLGSPALGSLVPVRLVLAGAVPDSLHRTGPGPSPRLRRAGKRVPHRGARNPAGLTARGDGDARYWIVNRNEFEILASPDGADASSVTNAV